MNIKPLDVLHKYYGYTSFRKGQENIITSIINKEDVLAIMPTGGGKSICYQVPALCLDGITIDVYKRQMHDYANKYILKNKEIRPVLYNSWEAMEFKVNAKEQINLAKLAKEIGTELFVVDDGWFGERHSTKDGLGDWYVNEGKFPNGLEELIKEVKNMNMKFGIWFEPVSYTHLIIFKILTKYLYPNYICLKIK